MKAASIVLAVFSILIVLAAFYPTSGDAASTAAADVADGRDDSVVFVEGDEAEPPALPEDLATPVASTDEAAAPAVKEVTYITPETLKKLKGFRRVRATPATADDGTVTFDFSVINPRPAYKRPVFQYNQ